MTTLTSAQQANALSLFRPDPTRDAVKARVFDHILVALSLNYCKDTIDDGFGTLVVEQMERTSSELFTLTTL